MDSNSALLSAVQSYQLPQLKKLCRTLSLRLSGNKSELQRRIIGYLQTDDGYRQGMLSPEISPLLTKSLNLPQLASHTRLEPMNEAILVVCICGTASARNVIQCRKCKTWQHRNCMGSACNMIGYECAKCQIEQMDPSQQVLDFLVLPFAVPIAGTVTVTRAIDLSANLIKAIKDAPLKSKVMIRCLVLDEEGYTHKWPAEVNLYMDEQSLFHATPAAAQDSRKRKDYPLDISAVLVTPHIKEESSVGYRHMIGANKKREVQSYALAIVLTQQLSVPEMIDYFISGQTFDVNQGRVFVSSFFQQGQEVSNSNMKIPLTCPLTQMKMEKPVRGWRCKHLHCFDLQSFVMWQESARTNRWRCPKCRSNCCHVIVDQYFQSIIDASKFQDNCDMVEFSSNGAYKFVPSVENRVANDEEEEESRGKRRAEEDAPAVGKKAKMGIEERKEERSNAFSWKDFMAGNLSPKELHGSNLYQHVASFILTDIRKVLRPPQDFSQVSGSRGTRQRSSAGSAACPIDIDD